MPRPALLRIEDVPAALALLTRLPVPASQSRGAAGAWAYPLAGLVVGALAGVAGWAALGLGAGLAAALALTVQVMLTGALHEDGLADCADGFWGGADTARRLAIMKDSQVGSFGVLALVLSLIARWSALSALFAAGTVLAPMIAAAVLSRAAMSAAMAVLPNARGRGLADSVGRPGAATVALAVALALTVAARALGPLAALAAGLAAAALAALTALTARAKIGGVTGDVLGAVQVISEIAALAALVAIMG